MADILGTIEGDALTGTNDADTISGLEGDDTIDGLDGNDALNGDEGDDTIFGGIGNDTINGGANNDTLYPGSGLNNVQGGDGDDELVLDTAILSGPGSVLNGGDGFDALVLKPQDGIPYFNGGTFTEYFVFNPAVGVTTISSIEALRFDSREGDFLDLVILEFQRAGSGMNTIIGGSGRDILYTIQFTPGDYTMPQLTFQNWTTDLNDPNNDFVVLLAGSNDNYTLRAREGLASIQGLRGSGGNDLLIGSSGSDSLDGREGVNELRAGGGDDWLFAENYTPFGGVSATNSFLNNLFDGGTGYDTLLVGGLVNFQGTLTDIENIYFQPARTAPVLGTAGLASAHLIISGAVAQGLPANLNLSGVGTVEINLGVGQNFNASAFTFSSTANVDVLINGSSSNDTITGTSGGDVIDGGDGDDTLDGGGGNDRLHGGNGDDTLIGGADSDVFEISGGQDIVSDFVQGTDKVDVSGAGFSSFAQLQPYLSESNGNVVWSFLYDGVVNTLTLQGVSLASLSANDFVFASPTLARNESGTENADTILGSNVNDILNGLGGDDQIFAKGGQDSIQAGDGNDTVVLDGVFAAGSNLNGGAGTDTLVATTSAVNSFGFVALGQSSITGFETLSFGTLAGQQLVVGMNPFQGGLVPDTPNISTIFSSVEGGDGTDRLIIGLPNVAGTYWMPTVTFDNWSSDDWFILNGGANTASYTLRTNDHDGRYVLAGANGNDTLIGSAGVESLIGGNGADLLQGEAGDDYLEGGAGNDTLEGGKGNDTMVGGADVDLFEVSEGQDIISDFVPGTDKIDVSGPGFTSFEQLQPYLSEVSGNAVWSFLYNGVINTLTLQGVSLASLSANDFVFASPTEARIESGTENADTLLGSDVNDILNGLGGDDSVFGEDGNDLLYGNGGGDTIHGGAGDDQLYGANSGFSGPQPGDDADYLDGGTGNDLLRGGDGDDTLLGGADDDNLRGDDGADIIDGGDGFDNVSFNLFDLAGPVTIDMRNVTGGSTVQLVDDGRGNLDSLSNIERIIVNATNANDVVWGSTTLANQLGGNDGNDTLRGGNVDDLIEGGNDNDLLVGNGGSDTILGGAGDDTLYGAYSPFSGPQPGDGADYLDGGTGNDLLRGGDGDDTLLGGADDDNLRGDDGADIIDGGDGFDNVSFNLFDLAGPVTIDMRNVTGGSTVQLVDDGRGNLDSISNIERIIVNATNANDVVRGSTTLANQLGGNDGNDTLRGGNADDLIEGGNDNDLLYGNGGADTIYGGTGDDQLYGASSGFSGPQPGDGADYLDGGTGNDLLRGGDGNDTLLGGADDDNLRGDDGADIIDGGDGFDVVSFNLFDLAGPVNIDMRSVTNGSAIQLVNDGRGNLDSVSNIESLIVNATNANDIVWGSLTLSNQLGGNDGDDTLYGGNADDLIEAGKGNDTVDGGGGIDTVTLIGAIEDFTIVYLGNASWRITDNVDGGYDNGVDIITNVEQLRIAPVEFSPTSTIVALNAPPEAQDQSVTLDEDQPASGQVEAIDLENGSLSFTLDQGPAHGSLTFNEDGTFLYVPDANYFGNDSFTFTASDGVNVSSTASVTLTVNPVADAALIGGQQTGDLTEGSVQGAPPGQTSGLLIISDVDGPTQFVPSETEGVYGSLSLMANGAWIYTLNESSAVTNSLNSGTTVTDSIIVAADDGTTSLVTVTIHGANDPAVIGGTTSGSALEAALLGGTSQATGVLSISDVDNPSQFVATVVAGLYGSFSITSAGAWTYTVNNSNPLVDALSQGENLQESFTVFAADGTSQLVSLTIEGSNDIRNGTNQANILVGTAGDDTLNGLGGNDILRGGLGDDTIDGGAGTDTASYSDVALGVTVNLSVIGPQDTVGAGIDALIGIENLEGTNNNDILTGNAEANTINGAGGNDLIEGGAGNDNLNGGDGIDTVSYAAATAAVTVSLATTSSQKTVGAGSDTLSFFENLIGSAFADRLTGNASANQIEGGAGADRITGAGGADQLYGGADNDIFAFSSLLDSLPSTYDTIFDFEGAGIAIGDIFDLSSIDAVPGGKDNAFSFIGSNAFSGVAGQLRQDTTSMPGFTLVQADTNGDSVADFQFAVAWGNEGTEPIFLGAQDFIL